MEEKIKRLSNKKGNTSLIKKVNIYCKNRRRKKIN
jgi:hypothetical protein